MLCEVINFCLDYAQDHPEDDVLDVLKLDADSLTPLVKFLKSDKQNMKFVKKHKQFLIPQLWASLSIQRKKSNKFWYKANVPSI
eukprot:TRINITY_DN14719_c0_g1_i1.p1 TRINITY_DN14719_c0_g1~~TRINITY_DN14719_c0_g1_i1.p1  ORF type:complete len:84 (+),score=10.85 TRINITY_DN14719_c0_g1_i1:67-318(+)